MDLNICCHKVGAKVIIKIKILKNSKMKRGGKMKKLKN